MKPCWAQYLLWLTLTLAGVSTMLSGCGQDGALYLPDDTEPQEEKDKQ